MYFDAHDIQILDYRILYKHMATEHSILGPENYSSFLYLQPKKHTRGPGPEKAVT